jgi:hypothetical protein
VSRPHGAGELRHQSGGIKMRELNSNEIEQAGGGLLLAALVVFDVVMIAYDAYQLNKILSDK